MKTVNTDEKIDLSSLYDDELIRNMRNAYRNMEELGMLSERQLKKYSKILKTFEKERKDGKDKKDTK